MAKRITPRDAQAMTVKELRSMLGKLNKDARARIRGLESAGYGETVAAQKIINPVRGMKKADLVAAVSDVSLFLSRRSSKASTLRADERKTLKTLHERGFKMVNSGNLRQFGKFMDRIKERQGKLRIDSDTVARIYDAMEEKGISPNQLEEAFGKYLNSEKGLLDLEKAISGEDIADGRTSAAKIRNLMQGYGWLE